MHGYELEEMKVTAETKSPIILFILQAGKGILWGEKLLNLFKKATTLVTFKNTLEKFISFKGKAKHLCPSHNISVKLLPQSF